MLLPLLLGIILFRKLEINSRLIVLLLAFATISQLASYFLERGEVWTFYNTYTVVDSVIWAYVFFRNSKMRVIRLFILIIVLLQVALAAYVFSSFGIKKEFYNEFVCLNSLLQTLWVVSFFYERYNSEEIDALEKEPMFWYCVGILIYAPTTYFHFAYYDVIQVEETNLASIHHFTNALMYFIFSIGIGINALRTLKFKNASSRNKS